MGIVLRIQRCCGFVRAVGGLLLLSVGMLCGGACSADLGQEEQVDSIDQAICFAIQVSATAGSLPSHATLNALPSTCTLSKNPEHRFEYQPVGASDTQLIRDWSPNPTVDWDASAVPDGRYRIILRTRLVGVHGVLKESTASTEWVVGDTCTAASLGIAATAPRRPGTLIPLTASANCVNGSPEFRFLVSGPAGSTTLREWSSEPVFSWDSTNALAGQYTFSVQARRVGNSSIDAVASQRFNLWAKCVSSAPSLSPAGRQPLDTPITIVAAGSCDGGVQPQYQFRYRELQSNRYTVLRPWDQSPTYLWDTTGLSASGYLVQVEIRGSDYLGPEQGHKSAIITLGGTCAVQDFSVLPNDPLPYGATLSFSASAACIGGTPEFRFLAWRADGSDGREIQPYGPSNSATFSTAGFGGEYVFTVATRAVGSQDWAQDSRAVNRVLADGCTAQSLSSRQDIVSGQVSLTATSSCTKDVPAAYEFAWRSAGTQDAWTPIRSWGGANASWDPGGLSSGNYELQVSVRMASSSAGAESFAITQQFVCLPGQVADGAGGCVSADQCRSLQHGCDPLAECTNTSTGRECGACASGYVGDGESGCLPVVGDGWAVTQVAAGNDFTCRVQNAWVECWGRRSWFSQIWVGKLATSANSVCAIGARNAEGLLDCSSPLQAHAPSGQFLDVAITDVNACAIRTDGTLGCWNAVGPVSAPDGKFVSIAMNDDFTCGVRQDGTLSCWSTSDASTVAAPAGQFSHVAAGAGMCALGSDGSVACWGLGSVAPPAGSFSVLAGFARYFCGIDQASQIQCWGDVPEHSSPRGNWTSLGLGLRHFCATSASGAMRCWGNNAVSQLVPPGTIRATKISVGNPRCYIAQDGSNGCFASEDELQLRGPAGNFVSVSASQKAACWLDAGGVPSCLGTEVPAGPYRALRLTDNYSCGIRLDGSLACWGDAAASLPAPPTGHFGALSVEARHACAIDPNGAIVCWGDNQYQQSSPPASNDFQSVEIGHHFGCALRNDGTVSCWGNSVDHPGWPNYTLPPLDGSFTAVAVGDEHACAIDQDQLVRCVSTPATFVNPSEWESLQIGAANVGSFDIDCSLRFDGLIECFHGAIRFY